MNGGYFDDKGNLRPEVVTVWAREIAEILASGDMATAQLRSFFGSLRLTEQRARSGTPFDQLKASVARLEPMAAASVGRKHAPRIFLSFIERNVEMAQRNRKSFDAFVKHFEAIVAYMTLFKPS